MQMRALVPDELALLRDLRRTVNPLELTNAVVEGLAAEWEPRVLPSAVEVGEQFAVVDSVGTPSGVVGPRWLFHRLGWPHRSAHVGLTSPSGLVLLQRRSSTKV